MSIQNDINSLLMDFDSFLKETKESKKFENTIDEFEIMPTGIEPLDFILGGGLALGSIMMLTGRAGCGKSALAANILASVQRYTDGKSLLAYIDTEGATSQKRLQELGCKKIKLVQGLTLVEINTFIQSIIKWKETRKLEKLPTVIVFDSVANAVTDKEMEAEKSKETIGNKAKELTLLMKKFTNIFPKYNISLIVINQIRSNVAVNAYSQPKAQIKGLKQGEALPGGHALHYSVNQLLYLTDTSKIEKDKYGFSGKEISAHCIKNRLFPPLIDVKLSFSYVAGYSNLWSKFLSLKEGKIIIPKGGWHYMKGYEKSFRIKDVIDLYINDREFRELFDKNSKEYFKKLKDDIIKEREFAVPDLKIEESLKEEDNNIKEKIEEEIDKLEK